MVRVKHRPAGKEYAKPLGKHTPLEHKEKYALFLWAQVESTIVHDYLSTMQTNLQKGHLESQWIYEIQQL